MAESNVSNNKNTVQDELVTIEGVVGKTNIIVNFFALRASLIPDLEKCCDRLEEKLNTDKIVDTASNSAAIGAAIAACFFPPFALVAGGIAVVGVAGSIGTDIAKSHQESNAKEEFEKILQRDKMQENAFVEAVNYIEARAEDIAKVYSNYTQAIGARAIAAEAGNGVVGALANVWNAGEIQADEAEANLLTRTLKTAGRVAKFGAKIGAFTVVISAYEIYKDWATTSPTLEDMRAQIKFLKDNLESLKTGYQKSPLPDLLEHYKRYPIHPVVVNKQLLQ